MNESFVFTTLLSFSQLSPISFSPNGNPSTKRCSRRGSEFPGARIWLYPEDEVSERLSKTRTWSGKRTAFSTAALSLGAIKVFERGESRATDASSIPRTAERCNRTLNLKEKLRTKHNQRVPVQSETGIQTLACGGERDVGLAVDGEDKNLRTVFRVDVVFWSRVSQDTIWKRRVALSVSGLLTFYLDTHPILAEHNIRKSMGQNDKRCCRVRIGLKERTSQCPSRFTYFGNLRNQIPNANEGLMFFRGALSRHEALHFTWQVALIDLYCQSIVLISVIKHAIQKMVRDVKMSHVIGKLLWECWDHWSRKEWSRLGVRSETDIS